MEMEHTTKESILKNKTMYKILLVTIKLLPAVMALFYLINTILTYIGIDLITISFIASVSLLSLFFMYLCSFVFRFCFYHRMFLHYILICNVLSWIDCIIEIPISSFGMFMIYMIIAGIAIFLIVLSYVKINKKRITEIGK